MLDIALSVGYRIVNGAYRTYLLPPQVQLSKDQKFKYIDVTETLIWYCPVTTIRTADTSIPMFRVLPHNH